MAVIKGPDFPTGGVIMGMSAFAKLTRTARPDLVVPAPKSSPCATTASGSSFTTCPTWSTRPPDRTDRELVKDKKLTVSPTCATNRTAVPRSYRHRAEEGRQRQRGAQPALQAHPAAGRLQRQHAGSCSGRAGPLRTQVVTCSSHCITTSGTKGCGHPQDPFELEKAEARRTSWKGAHRHRQHR